MIYLLGSIVIFIAAIVTLSYIKKTKDIRDSERTQLYHDWRSKDICTYTIDTDHRIYTIVKKLHPHIFEGELLRSHMDAAEETITRWKYIGGVWVHVDEDVVFVPFHSINVISVSFGSSNEDESSNEDDKNE